MGENNFADYLEERLEIFEEQLRKMADALVTLARIEERQSYLAKDLDKLQKDQTECFKRLREVESAVDINITKMGTGEKFLWIVVTVTITAIVSTLSTIFIARL